MNKTKKWDRNTFTNARDWVIASSKPFARGVDLDKYADCIAKICKKQRGAWTVLKTRPRDIERGLIWDAFKHGRHAVQWGDLNSWGESTTMLLMRASEQDRETFEFVFDTTIELAKQRKAA